MLVVAPVAAWTLLWTPIRPSDLPAAIAVICVGLKAHDCANTLANVLVVDLGSNLYVHGKDGHVWVDCNGLLLLQDLLLRLQQLLRLLLHLVWCLSQPRLLLAALKGVMGRLLLLLLQDRLVPAGSAACCQERRKLQVICSQVAVCLSHASSDLCALQQCCGEFAADVLLSGAGLAAPEAPHQQVGTA